MTEQSTSAARTRAAYQLRLHGGTEIERLIDVRPGKHSIGSGPRCQIRLDAAGVGALECLLVRDRTGLRARRWSDKTLLNSQPFEEAKLVDGDVLSVGPVELVVIGPPEGEVALDGYEQGIWANGDAMRSACDALDEIFLVEEASSQTLQPAHQRNENWQRDCSARPTQRIPRAAANAPTAPSLPPDTVTKATVRRRSRRALEVLRRQRRDHDELITRVSELEQLLSQALAEPHVPQPEPLGERPHDSAEFDERVAALETELGSLRDQLATRNGELQQARYSIDVLERQLIDSQHTMHAFADERLHWEEQFNEIESRLARYVERIQELEQQLDGSQIQGSVESGSAAAPSDEQGIDWELEVGGATDDATPAKEEQTVEQVATADEEWPPESVDHAGEWLQIVEEPATETSEADVETAVATPSEPVFEPIDASEGQAPAESEAAAPGVVASVPAPADVNREVAEALEHLRGVSIWREEPAKEAQAGANEDSKASPTASAHGNSAPASFLDRYAHMFPHDDTPNVSKLAEDSTAPLTEAVPPPEAHTEEESVEQYMAKLLARMRGGPTGNSSAAVPSGKPVDLTEQVASSSASPTVEETPQPPPFTNLDEIKAKSAPEQPSDMAAMRALANQSARHALSLHAARKLRRTAITRVIVTALGASVSVYLLLNSSTWRSLSFAAGCAAGFAALYWGILTMGTLLKGFQLGAFDEYEEEIAPGKSLNPPLPIDVEQSLQEESAPSDAESGDAATGGSASVSA